MPSGQPLRLRGQVRQDRESSMSSPWTLVIFPDAGEVKANGSEMDVKFAIQTLQTTLPPKLYRHETQPDTVRIINEAKNKLENRNKQANNK